MLFLAPVAAAAGGMAAGARLGVSLGPPARTDFRAVWRILDEPTQADLDHSGYLDPLEAGLLGTALALDALGAGVSLGMVGGVSWAFALAVGAAQLGVFCAGFGTGRLTAQGRSPRTAPPLGVAAGSLVVLLGFLRLLS